ncbi:MAG: hypothetical protein ISS28_02135 [Candidatus Cloacimonetes bacterium]|nr:hypothetical protein [Candidatus Cloacimonadota bacterium]MBL7085887.1 hypothetical protein [Candidatus Cloacimonadota bacterium]
MKKQILLIIFLLLWVSCFAEVLTVKEIQLLNDMLLRNDMDSTAMNFLKDWSRETQFKLPVIVEIINHPLKFPVFVEQTESIIERENPKEILSKFSNILFSADSLNCFEPEYFKEYFLRQIKRTKDIFTYVEYVWDTADIYYQKAWGNLTSDEKKQIEYFSYTVWQEDQDSLLYQQYFQEHGITEYPDLEVEDIIPLLKKIDFSSLMQSAIIFQTGLDVMQKNIIQKGFNWKHRLEKDTRWGRFCIGSYKDDTYNQAYSFVLEPAGDDIYRMPIQTGFYQPYYWIIDFSGDDSYINYEIGGLFHALCGLGAHIDFEGNDVYQGGDFTFSSFYGYQVGWDKDGNDIYTGGLHSLGASTFGVSILFDKSGNDMYSVTELGEGFGGTMGAGLLIDFGGNDLYYAGGKYLHEPLAPLDYRTLSQGFGFGVRPMMGGGIGIVYDKEGNDSYQGGVYAQGVAYWYALGILIDKEGNDFYDAVYYPQGSGIHLAGGFLLDEKGEDHYYSKHGPGQGAGHDYAVGFLIDRAGNDSYSVEGGNGLGLTNSVGIFIDVSGDDRYERNFGSNYGFANIARQSGGIGLFLDTGGNDLYPAYSDTTMNLYKNNFFWKQGIYGIGWDTLFVIDSITAIEEMAEEQASDVDSLADIETVFDIASEWGVGSSSKRVKRAEEILLKRDVETAEYIYENKLDTKKGLIYRAIKNFALKSEEFKKYIPLALNNPDSLVVKNAIRLIGEISDSTYIDSLNKFIEQNKYLSTVLYALGKMKSDKSTIVLQDFIESPSERLRVITARGLKQINTPLSRKLLMTMKNDQSFLVRTIVRLM